MSSIPIVRCPACQKAFRRGYGFYPWCGHRIGEPVSRSASCDEAAPRKSEESTLALVPVSPPLIDRPTKEHRSASRSDYLKGGAVMLGALAVILAGLWVLLTMVTPTNRGVALAQWTAIPTSTPAIRRSAPPPTSTPEPRPQPVYRPVEVPVYVPEPRRRSSPGDLNDITGRLGQLPDYSATRTAREQGERLERMERDLKRLRELEECRETRRMIPSWIC